MDDNAVVLQPNAQRGQEPDHGAEGHHEDSLEAISLTVLVPTRNEAENVAKLLDDLSAGSKASRRSVFVDDSDDSTPAVIEAEATRRERRCPPGSYGASTANAPAVSRAQSWPDSEWRAVVGCA